MHIANLQHSRYHRFLRVSSVVFAVVLVFQSGMVSHKTAVLSQMTGTYLMGAVGMSASVEPTELNQYTAALTQKERELIAREQALAAREIAVGFSQEESGAADRTTYLLAGVLFILLVLILLNYVLDYMRYRETLVVKQV